MVTWGQTSFVDFQNRKVKIACHGDHLRMDVCAVIKGHLNMISVVHNVLVGDDVSFRVTIKPVPTCSDIVGGPEGFAVCWGLSRPRM
jgi:hypothetical protein